MFSILSGLHGVLDVRRDRSFSCILDTSDGSDGGFLDAGHCKELIENLNSDWGAALGRSLTSHSEAIEKACGASRAKAGGGRGKRSIHNLQ